MKTTDEWRAILETAFLVAWSEARTAASTTTEEADFDLTWVRVYGRDKNTKAFHQAAKELFNDFRRPLKSTTQTYFTAPGDLQSFQKRKLFAVRLAEELAATGLSATAYAKDEKISRRRLEDEKRNRLIDDFLKT